MNLWRHSKDESPPCVKFVKGIGSFFVEGSSFVDVEVALLTLVAPTGLVSLVASKPPWLPDTSQVLRHVSHCLSHFSTSFLDCCQASGASKIDGSSFAQCGLRRGVRALAALASTAVLPADSLVEWFINFWTRCLVTGT